MFDLIDENKLRRLLIWKYFFQIIISPLIISVLVNLFLFFCCMIIRGLDATIELETQRVDIIGIDFHGWAAGLFLCFLIMFVLNLLSIIPFINLIIDDISKKHVSQIITIIKILPAYELQCLRESKKFICDTFSRKKNMEIFIYDENKKKYRLFWNENYSSVKDVPDDFFEAEQLRITYFKYSRIICDVEILDQNGN